MCDLGTEDRYGEEQEASPFSFPLTLKPYKLGHIKRPTEMALIFDASMSTEYGLDKSSYAATADAYGIDKASLYDGTKTYMTDAYGDPNLNSSKINSGLSIDMLPGYESGTVTSADINVDIYQNLGNIRFRHSRNSQANALMVDGHVQIFSYNNKIQQDASGRYLGTDLQEKNINVNP
jgi:prepilin-type processing-associated H-X9-DG protein